MAVIMEFIYKLIQVFYQYQYSDKDLQTIKQILEEYDEYLVIGSSFRDILRSIGFGLIRIMDSLTHTLLDILGHIFEITQFDTWLRESSAVSGTVLERLGFNKLGGYLSLIIPIALVITGIALAFGANEIKGSKVLKNIALSALVLAILPGSINMMSNLTTNFYKENNITISQEARAQAREYIYDSEWIFSDLKYYESRFEQKNNISPELIFMIDINDRVSTKGQDHNAYAKLPDQLGVFRHRLMINSQNGATSVKPIEGSADWIENNLPSLTSYYYRFHFRFLPLFLLYLAYLGVIVFTIARCIRLGYEIVINHLVTTFLAATDFLSGKKLKEALLYLFYTYLTLMYAVVAIVVFSKFITFVTQSSYFSDLRTLDTTGIIQALIIFVVALAVIDGPALIQRITGIDAGLSDGYNALDRMMRAGRTTTRAVGGAVHAGKNLISGGKNVKKGIDRMADRISKPETPKQAASREKKEADRAASKADPNKTKQIDVPKSGNVNGKPVSTMKDVADAANSSGAKTVQVTYGMSKKASARKDSDRDQSQDHKTRTINYQPGGKTSLQSAIQDDMKRAAAEEGQDVSDYAFDGSNVNMKGLDMKDNKKSQGGADEAGAESGQAPLEEAPSNIPTDPSPTLQADNSPVPEGNDIPDGSGTNEPVQSPSEIQSANTPSGSGSPSQNQEQPTSGQASHAAGMPQRTATAPQAVTKITPAAGNTPSPSIQQAGTGKAPSISRQGNSTGTTTQAGTSSPEGTRIPAQQIPPTRDFSSPVTNYRNNAGAYQALQMNVPVTTNQRGWADVATAAANSAGKDSQVYTQVDMSTGEGLSQKTETIGFNYDPSSDGGYKKAFNSAMTEWKHQNPDTKYDISSVNVFKTSSPQKEDHNRRRRQQ